MRQQGEAACSLPVGANLRREQNAERMRMRKVVAGFECLNVIRFDFYSNSEPRESFEPCKVDGKAFTSTFKMFTQEHEMSLSTNWWHHTRYFSSFAIKSSSSSTRVETFETTAGATQEHRISNVSASIKLSTFVSIGQPHGRLP
uniref:Uncharacterized protein n=1 Tax=Physcomitrium patens TaxID=3218 RepID=A0A2K1KKW1_PHYPA|nr:hypothetical protein PHYPA_008095 [Physcomitrium patens]